MMDASIAELPKTGATQAPPVVFVVDDDISVRESLGSLLSFFGWQTETFESAGAFLARAKAFGPSCLVLDLHLTDLSGLEPRQRIQHRGRAMPIIFITGDPDIPSALQAMKAGAVEF